MFNDSFITFLWLKTNSLAFIMYKKCYYQIRTKYSVTFSWKALNNCSILSIKEIHQSLNLQFSQNMKFIYLRGPGIASYHFWQRIASIRGNFLTFTCFQPLCLQKCGFLRETGIHHFKFSSPYFIYNRQSSALYLYFSLPLIDWLRTKSLNSRAWNQGKLSSIHVYKLTNVII